jgi:hypothetical protein
MEIQYTGNGVIIFVTMHNPDAQIHRVRRQEIYSTAFSLYAGAAYIQNVIFRYLLH